MTVWRELRRIEQDAVNQDLHKALIKAADEGDWQRFTDLMGGAVIPRKERPVRPYMIERDKPNRYGQMMNILKGLWFGPDRLITRLQHWTINAIAPDAANDTQGEGALAAS